jgi:hypothetical protein
LTVEARTAIEALRAGVPDRAAVRQMGTEQTDIDQAFEEVLAAVGADTGGFGAEREGGWPEWRLAWAHRDRNGRGVRHR